MRDYDRQRHKRIYNEIKRRATPITIAIGNDWPLYIYDQEAPILNHFKRKKRRTDKESLLDKWSIT